MAEKLHFEKGSEMPTSARYHSAKLHLHSCFESAASMRGHCFQAKRLGVEVVWITDHDSRICWKRDSAFWLDDFERDHLWTIAKKRKRFDGWRASALDDGVEGEAALANGVGWSGKRSMRVWARCTQSRNEWGSLRVDFSTGGKTHQRSLMTGVSLDLAVRPERGLGENGRLRILVELSQKPPNFDIENLTYVVGGYNEDNGPRHIPLTDLKREEWNILHLDLTEDVSKYTEGGVDNVFGGLSLFLDTRRGELVELYVDDFRLNQVHTCQTAFAMQKELASEFSDQFGVVVYTGAEISASGRHKCAFGSWIPILDRNLKPEGYSEEEAVTHVKSHRGAFSLSHPFSKWKRQALTEKQREEIVQSVLESYKDSSCQGADLIEVGYPEGRHGFPLGDYLKLWDGLSRAGIVIAGIGVSDAHNNISGWESGNNFVNWIRSETIKEEDLVHGLLSGDIYMGDPTFFRGNLQFTTADGCRMGQIVIGRKGSKFRFSMAGCRPGWKVRWIVNGAQEKTLQVSDENFEFIRMITVRGFSFTRFEMYNEDERCILLTNPIYFADKASPRFPQHKIVESAER